MKLLLASTFDVLGDKIDQIPDLELANKRVVCVITAALGEENHDWLDSELAQIKKRVKSLTTYDIAGKTKQDLEQEFTNADIIYLSGGNTYYLLEHVKKSRFSEVLNDKLKAGVIYFGSSAGAIIICPRIDFIGELDNPRRANLNEYTGLGLIDFLIMPHIDSEKYGAEIKKIIDKLNNAGEKILGLCDSQALYVQDNYIRIY